MSLNLTLLKNELLLLLQVLCKNHAHISSTIFLVFNGCFEIMNKSIREASETCSGKFRWLSRKLKIKNDYEN